MAAASQLVKRNHPSLHHGANSRSGNASADPAAMSFNSVVPASVPSEVHSSWPVPSASAENSREPPRVASDANEPDPYC